jgi:hypothetical protein
VQARDGSYLPANGKVLQNKTLAVDGGRKQNQKIVFTLLGCC